MLVAGDWQPSIIMEHRKDIDPLPLGTKPSRRYAYILRSRKPKRYAWNNSTLLYYYPYQKLREVEWP